MSRILFPATDLSEEAWETDRQLIDPGLIDGLSRYFNQRIRTGDFLYAVLTNDLTGAMGRASHLSAMALPQLVKVLVNYAPSYAWGSPAKVEAWLKGGGDA
jgi:hypothetical protein